MTRLTEIAAALAAASALAFMALGTLALAACGRPSPHETNTRTWPADPYTHKQPRIPDQPVTQTVLGVVATDKAPSKETAKELKRKPPLVGVEVLTVEDIHGEVYLQITVVHPRRPFILRLQKGRNKPMFQLGREGVIHAFKAHTGSLRTWGTEPIPKGVGVKTVHLYLEPDLSHPIAFKTRSNQQQKVRWPPKGGITRFPLMFALAFSLDNAQTLIRTGGVNKRGRLIAERSYRVKTSDVTAKNVKTLLRAAAQDQDPKGLAILR